jgi:transcriptional antiterminator RfaH
MNVSKVTPECCWHLAQYKPNCANIAKRNLARQDFDVFLPLEAQTRTKGRNFIDEKRPFFPGYIFVGASNMSGPVQAIQSTYGISRLVRVGLKPAIVPPQLIDELMGRCNSDGVLVGVERIVKGGKVRLANGPFANLVGEVERVEPNRRVWILLDVMGQETKVSVPTAAVQVAV